MTKKFIFVFIITLLVLTISSLALGASCSTTSADYLAYNNSVKPGVVNIIQYTGTYTNTPDYYTIQYINYEIIGANHNEDYPSLRLYSGATGTDHRAKLVCQTSASDNCQAHKFCLYSSDATTLTNNLDIACQAGAGNVYNITIFVNNITVAGTASIKSLDINGVNATAIAGVKIAVNNKMSSQGFYTSNTYIGTVGETYVWSGYTCPAGPPTYNTLNLTEGSISNNSIYNTLSLNLNLTANSTVPFNCSMYINEILNQTGLNYSNGTNTLVGFNLSFGSTQELNLNYSFKCTNIYNSVNTSTYNFYIDNVQPNIYWKYPTNINTTVIDQLTNTTLLMMINFSDNNLYSTKINITDSLGTNIYTNITTGLTGLFKYNLSNRIDFGNNVSGRYTATSEVCDGHTNNNISFKSVRKFNNELSFDDVKIYLEDKLETNIIDYTHKEDRYNFEFKTKTKSKLKTFIVESKEYIDILDNTEYKGHLVIGNKWIDFEGLDINFVSVERINNNKVKVYVENKYNSEYWRFNSIGELNCVSESRYFYMVNSTEIYSSNVFVGDDTTINLNVTGVNSTYTTVTAILNFNGTNYDITGVSGYNHILFSQLVSIPFTSTSLNYTFNWSYTLFDTSFNLTPHNITSDPISVISCDLGYGIEALRINFKTEDLSYTEGNFSIYMEAWHTSPLNYTIMQFNLTTSKTNYTFCIYPNNSNFTMYSQMDYYNSSTHKTYYLVNYKVDNVSDNLDLYLTSGSTQIQFRVVDFNDIAVDGSYIKVLKYFLGVDNYLVSEIIKTDDDGYAYGQLIQNTEWYKFIIEYENEVKLYTEPTKIVLSTKKFRINLGTAYFDQFNAVNNLYYTNISFDNDTKMFSFVYSDTTGISRTVCLRTERTGINGNFLMNESCITSSAGTLYSNISELVGTNTYTATAYLVGSTYPLSFRTVIFDNTYKIFGKEGIFYTSLLVIGVVTVSIFSPPTAIIMALVGLGFSIILKIFSITWAMMVILIIMGVIVIYKQRGT